MCSRNKTFSIKGLHIVPVKFLLFLLCLLCDVASITFAPIKFHNEENQIKSNYLFVL